MAVYPQPQRNLRTPVRPAGRIVADADHLVFLAGHLSPRDRWITRLTHEHRVLTSHQLVEVGWPSRRSANYRLRTLYQWRVLDRFQPLIPVGRGLAPAHYVCDIGGASILAAEDGLDMPATGYRRVRAMAIAHSLRLSHQVAVNGFFTRLIAHARVARAGTLTAWWSETRCLRAFGDLVRPDAYGRWASRHGEIEWFLELDWATEPHTRLARKIADYARLAAATHITTPVLFWFPSTEREAGARRALAKAVAALDHPDAVPIATTAATLTPPHDQLDPTLTRWLPLTTRRAGRLTLGELTHAWPRLRPPTPTDGRTADATTETGLRPPTPMPPADDWE